MIPRRSGFSLIETLFALGIGAVVAGAVVTLIISQIQLTATNNRNIISQQNVRGVLNFMADEIQLMGAQGIPEPYVSLAETHAIEFLADVNGDGDLDRIKFYLLNGQLQRDYSTSADGGASWSAVTTDILLENVTALFFTYYEPNNVVTTDVNLLTSMEIALTISTANDETAFTSGKIAEQKMVSRVTIRNRRI